MAAFRISGRTMARTRSDWQRWARRGTTTQRGYGSPHQAERERRLAAYQPGDICAHGGEPLPYPRLRWTPAGLVGIARQFLDLPHNADRSGYLPGLACRAHNRSDGQRMTTAILRAKRGITVTVQRSARQW
jgi:hypothetical protein